MDITDYTSNIAASSKHLAVLIEIQRDLNNILRSP
jgi:hypothetical protein